MPSPDTNFPRLDAARRRARVSAEAVVSAYIHELAQPQSGVRPQHAVRPPHEPQAAGNRARAPRPPARAFRVSGSLDGRRAPRRREAAHRGDAAHRSGAETGRTVGV